ncbi:glycosyltransferase family 4 protein [Pseudactinotalea sp. Z1732]|uniref:glycosyltransferase family 4 protein n=1 Tax=Micrococcales TaxID=85006 RepID=UPI003C7EC1C5
MSTQTELLAELTRRCAGRRVAYVCADPGIGVFGTKGASVHVQAVVRTLRRAGAHVEVFAAKTGGPAPADLADLPVHLLPLGAGGRSGADRERRLIEADTATAAVLEGAGGFDAYYERYSLFSAGGARWARAVGIPVIVEVNAPLIDEHHQQRGLVHREAAERALAGLMDAADLAVCVSDPVRTWVRDRAPHTHAVVVPNGADIHRVRPRDTGDRAVPPVPTVGFVGTLKPWHGVEMLLDAVAPLLRPGHLPGLPRGARLLIVGDGPLAERIDTRVAGLGIAGHVERTGSVAPARVPELLARMDIGTAPYPADAGDYFSPLKVLEYLAAGLPVVASDVGQLPTMVDAGRTGLLVPPSDVRALRTALAGLLVDPDRRHRLGRAARAEAERKHSWEHTMVHTLRALPAGLENRSVPAA